MYIHYKDKTAVVVIFKPFRQHALPYTVNDVYNAVNVAAGIRQYGYCCGCHWTPRKICVRDATNQFRNIHRHWGMYLCMLEEQG